MRQAKVVSSGGESPSRLKHERQHENMNSDSERKTRVGRFNQPPKPECCRTEGQAEATEKDAESRTTAWKRTQGNSQAASGSRTSLKQSSLETLLCAAHDPRVLGRYPHSAASLPNRDRHVTKFYSIRPDLKPLFRPVASRLD